MGFFTSDAPVNSTSDLVAAEFAKERMDFYKQKRFKARKDELDLSNGMDLALDFPDEEGLLETALCDLKKMLRSRKIREKGSVPFAIRFEKSYGREEAALVIGEDSVTLTGGDTEGIRRGIYQFCRFLENAEGPFVKKGLHHLKYAIRNRISRSYYGPIHRPPNNIDELLSDVDYYPEPYLSTLASEGINVLWLTVELSEVSYSSIAPEKDPRMEERLDRLRKTVERCRRYGIRIFIFFIEPAGFVGESSLVKKYPELEGVDWGYNMHCFCPTSKTAYTHLYEQMYNLFKNVPHLGGAINIPAGEAICSCFGGGNTGMKSFSPFKCPRCHDLPAWRVLNNSLEPMVKGMRDASPGTDYVCWFYQPSNSETVHEWMYECVRHLPEGVTFLYNFESGIQVKQQGRLLRGSDYWQAIPGSSERFRSLTACAASAGVPAGAKMQISNDHAMATVPVIAVPETLYKKYKIIHDCKLDTVMYSWYFGCFPGLMNRAALELSAENMEFSCDEFLDHLALEEFGKTHQKLIAQSWKYFSKAYSCYPVNAGFQYRGPVNAGLSWTLYPEAKLADLTHAWQSYADSGDCVGQCLKNYPLELALAQTQKMSRLWDKGAALIRPLLKKYPKGSEQYKLLARSCAVGITFRNAALILKFYLERRKFYQGNRRSLSVMEQIVRESIVLCAEMEKFCREDLFIGYHSEAEMHKFSADLLVKRKKALQKLLAKDFVRMKKKDYVPAYPDGTYQQKMDCTGKETKLETFSFKVEREDDHLLFTVRCPREVKSENLISEYVAIQLCDTLGSCSPIVRAFDLNGRKFSSEAFADIKIIDEKDHWGAVAKVDLEEYKDHKVIAFDILRQRMADGKIRIESWADPEAKTARNYASEVKNAAMGLLDLENK